MKKNCVKFDDFINPKGSINRFKNKNLDINELYSCSYVVYIILEHCNGEILNNYFVIGINDKKDLLNYYFGPYIIYAINSLDRIVCEVI